MGEYLLYGLDEAGEPIFTEQLPAMDLTAVRDLAQARLGACHGVEVWHGPMCVLRIRRPGAAAD